jgi:AcrR family transcriptional regulator
MSGRPRSVSDEEVFAGVTRAIGRVGPAGLTFAAVSAEVGLSAPALAQRFGSKRGLLVAYAGQGQAVPHAFDEAERRARSALGALHLALELLIAPVDSHEALANSIAFLHMDLTDPDLKAHAVAQSRGFRRRVQALLDRAVEQAELVEVDTGPLATAVYTTYSGALLTWAIDGTGSLTRWMRRHIDATLAPYFA